MAALSCFLCFLCLDPVLWRKHEVNTTTHTVGALWRGGGASTHRCYSIMTVVVLGGCVCVCVRLSYFVVYVLESTITDC